jgi:hypothetical protein
MERHTPDLKVVSTKGNYCCVVASLLYGGTKDYDLSRHISRALRARETRLILP